MTIASRIESLDWSSIETSLWQYGYAATPPVLNDAECTALAQMYDREDLFRKRVIMAQHAFGVGEYKYFQHPLPNTINELRGMLYARLAPVATAWEHALGKEIDYPERLDDFLDICHRAGQERPTPLLLQYEQDGYNCLHQDLYGELAFPLQATILLSAPGQDFEGGEFVLVEQRPRMQSRPEVVPLRQGEAVIFAVNERPVEGKRGIYRVKMRHGVSRLRQGERLTLGVIFHDAK